MLQSAELGSLDPVKKDPDGKPVFNPAWEWRCTTKPGLMYIHLFNWPKEKFELPKVNTAVKRAYLLADPGQQALKFEQSAEGVTIHLPDAAPDPIASVLVLGVDQSAK